MKAAILQASTLAILLSLGMLNGCSSRSDAQISSDVQSKINNDINFIQVYPIISIGFGFKF